MNIQTKIFPVKPLSEKKSYIPYYYGHGKENSPDYRLRQRQGGRHLRHHGRTLQVRGSAKTVNFYIVLAIK